MRTDTAAIVLRDNYTQPAYWVQSLDMGFDLDPKKRRKMMANLTGEERFRKIANEYIIKTFVKGVVDKSAISRLLEHVKKLEYKNPKAFVLAYYFITMRKKDTELSDTISEYIADEDGGADITDIIRYIRYIRYIIDIRGI